MRKLIIILLIIFLPLKTSLSKEYNNNQNSLNITIPLYYDPLSKIKNSSIIGSSSIVLTQDNLKKYDYLPLHSIIEKETGIKVRSLYGYNTSGSKSTIDIRGMGAQAKSNVLILVNGQRLNNIDMGEIDYTSIPKSSINKIEIFKGNAASVLYGEGAVGGTINIITDKNNLKNKNNTIKLSRSSFNTSSAVYEYINNFNEINYKNYFSHFVSDGYRDENEQKNNNLVSEIKFPHENGFHFLSLNFNEQLMSTPSDRSQTELYTDRKGSDTPDDYINSIGGSLLYSSDFKLNNENKILVNGSVRLKNSKSDLQSTNFPSHSDTTLENYQFSPRINMLQSFRKKELSSVYGVDLQFARYSSDRKKNKFVAPLHVYDAHQLVQSLYSQLNLKFTDSLSFGTGIRLERNFIYIKDYLYKGAVNYASWNIEHEKYSDREVNNAFNLGLDFKISPKYNFYSRIGSGYRYPNIDDRIGGSGNASFHLNTQKTTDFEIGLKFEEKYINYQLSSFIINSKNEIGYDADNFVNYNLSSTQRYGIEFKLQNYINNKINILNNLTFVKAEYTSDADTNQYNSTVYNASRKIKGNDIPLVPNFSIDSSLEYKLNKNISINSSFKYQDDMRMENDEENFQHTKIPSYLICNIGFNSNMKNFLLSFDINNIFDTKYFNYAVSSSNTQGTYNAYPEPGRTVSINLNYNF